MTDGSNSRKIVLSDIEIGYIDRCRWLYRKDGTLKQTLIKIRVSDELRFTGHPYLCWIDISIYLIFLNASIPPETT